LIRAKAFVGADGAIPKSHTRPATVLGDELDAGLLKGAADGGERWAVSTHRTRFRF
jgi:hypothetical protein